MTTIKTLAAVAFAASTLAGAEAFAKAHDQGVADGTQPPSTSGVVADIPGPGISSVVGGGQRGDAASAAGGDNAVSPVDRPGQNR